MGRLKFRKDIDTWFMVQDIVDTLEMDYINTNQIICIRSERSKSRAIARCWEFPRIWQLALSQKPHYIIEVVSEKFDSLRLDDKQKILIHELLHIPKNFSGAVRPHGRYVGREIDRRINCLYEAYKKKKG